MDEALKHYHHLFTHLRMDTSQSRWPKISKHKAPHKPLLLLSILDLIDASSISKNFIEPSLELVEIFNQYWELIMPIGSTASMSFPFYHLDSSKFWHLISQKGEQHQQGRKVGSVKRLLELYQGAKLDDDLFVLLCNKENRQIIRKALISHYFTSDAHNILWDQATINKQSSEYCKHLLKNPEGSIENIEEISTPIYEKARSQGFRKAIVRLYEHRCALCGIRILTTEGHTVVDAAHIIPWSQTQNDSPQNGIALCKLCHWSFDEGLMGVDKEYNVLISRSVRKNQNYSGHIEMLSGRGMIKPDDCNYWPDQVNLNSHRKNKFRYS